VNHGFNMVNTYDKGLYRIAGLQFGHVNVKADLSFEIHKNTSSPRGFGLQLTTKNATMSLDQAALSVVDFLDRLVLSVARGAGAAGSGGWRTEC